MLHAKGAKFIVMLKGIVRDRNVVSHRQMKAVFAIRESAKTARTRNRNNEELEMSADASNQVTVVNTCLQPASVVTV